MLSYFRQFFASSCEPPRLAVDRVADHAAYKVHLKNNQLAHQNRWHYELQLAAGEKPFITKGCCYACAKEVEFKTDFMYSHTVVNGKPVPNWRERVLCPCQLNNRTRASIQILDETLQAKKTAKIYIAEQVTPLYSALKKRFPNLVGSEYLGDKIAWGEKDARGVRNESITKLTFANNTFDYLLNFDVLEHVPDVNSALNEIYRVLKPSGTLLLSVPFLPGEYHTSVRAKLDGDGNLVHLQTPQYHGDPIHEAGCLCFQDFGWELLDQMRAIGFAEVSMLLYWSDELGYYGVEQMMIVGRK